MGASFTKDLSAFSDGDICHIKGVSGSYSGSIVPYVNIDDTFIWDSNTTYSKEFDGVSSNYRGRVTINPSTGVISMADWNGSAWTANYEVHQLYVYKQNPSWIKVSKAYKKISGSWVLQNDLTTVFSDNIKYRKAPISATISQSGTNINISSTSETPNALIVQKNNVLEILT